MGVLGAARAGEGEGGKIGWLLNVWVEWDYLCALKSLVGPLNYSYLSS